VYDTRNKKGPAERTLFRISWIELEFPRFIFGAQERIALEFLFIIESYR